MDTIWGSLSIIKKFDQKLDVCYALMPASQQLDIYMPATFFWFQIDFMHQKMML